MSIGNLWKEALVLFNNNPNSDVIAVSSKISWLVPPCCLWKKKKIQKLRNAICETEWVTRVPYR